MKLGFIGLGTMGLPMVTNLLRKGYEVHVYDVAKDRVEIAVRANAVKEDSIKAVAKNSEVVLLSLPKEEISKEVTLGEDGILRWIRKGGVIIELSTVSPYTIVQIAEKAVRAGVDILDAPVSGGRAGAERGELTVMVGGSHETFLKCKPIFESIGKRVYYVGGSGSAEAVKLLNSLIAIGNLMIAREALTIAKSQGVDIKKMYEIINASTGQSWMWSNWIGGMMNGNKTGSTARIMLKDMSYAIKMLKDSTKLPISTKVLETIDSLASTIDLDEDAKTFFEFVFSGTN
ncbi:MAG: NAD(P)-dependent oxidoreductase [Nitrososphaerota archaeon]|jgi:3-hydroxyisobutyrate dehydrogenase-like beta-hydroxyacid dehydrogenase|nr:NAD(P)-dependent oxidoreductase [Nitrososphaerota archaeon]